MKEVDVKNQVRLGLAKCFELCISGIRYRLFRSAVTVFTVALAVAFLMTMLGQSIIGRSVRQAVGVETAPRQIFVGWVGRLEKPMSDSELAAILWAQPANPDRLAEVCAWGQLSPADLASLQEVAAREKTYVSYFGRLDEGNRSLLLGSDLDKGSAIFTKLLDPAGLKSFEQRLDSMPFSRPGSSEEFAAFVRQWNQLHPLRQRVLDGHAQAVTKLGERLQGRRAGQMLAKADASTGGLLKEFGFILPPSQVPGLASEATLELNADRISRQLLSQPSVRSSLAQSANIPFDKVTEQTIFEETNTPAKARQVIQAAERVGLTPEQMVAASQARLGGGTLSEEQGELGNRLASLLRHTAVQTLLAARANIPPAEVTTKVLYEQCRSPEMAGEILRTAQRAQAVEMTAEEMASASRARLRQVDLASVEGALAGEDAEGFMGFSQRTLWLIVVSFGVCAVGIANAMLMSVTERFREIATMKCLGAMDGFIMVLFVLESCLQGLVGGLAGAMLGVLLGLIRGWWEFGALAFNQLPGMGLLYSAGISMAAGIILAAGAAVYPAWVASRLAPMEAMRVE